MSQYEALKKECYAVNMHLPQLGLVVYTFGNVSVIDRDNAVFAIKPSGVDYDKLKWQDIVIVDLDGNTVEGDMSPSSDTLTHALLYQKFNDIGAVVHTHSTYAVAWSQAGRDVPLFGTTHADHLATSIPCTEIMADERIMNNYETETGFQVVDCFEAQQLDPSKVPMVLVAGHGPFAWGKTGEKAVYNAKILEELCKMAFLTEQINPSSQPLKNSLVRKHYNRKHGSEAYYGQH
jgi:L-ribulose-5-phosphate 4-epimerase